jgi:hypothetical protein
MKVMLVRVTLLDDVIFLEHNSYFGQNTEIMCFDKKRC